MDDFRTMKMVLAIWRPPLTMGTILILVRGHTIGIGVNGKFHLLQGQKNE
jgi:hypothetical protein